MTQLLPFTLHKINIGYHDLSTSYCPPIPDNVFSVASPAAPITVSSCPGLDSDFDQVVSTSVQPPAPLASSADPSALPNLDLPLSPSPAPTISCAPPTAKRRRSGRGVEASSSNQLQAAAKRPRLGIEVTRLEEGAASPRGNLEGARAPRGNLEGPSGPSSNISEGSTA